MFAQGVSFVTLIVLFYLGAERLLDNRYLNVESRVPTRFGLLIDLFTCGATAVWFVILADTFPDTVKHADQTGMELALTGNLSYFTLNLLILYVVDSLFIMIQIRRIYKNRTHDFTTTMHHHWFWLSLNVLGVVLLYPVIINFPNDQLASSLSFLVPSWTVPIFGNYLCLSLYIIILHSMRFFTDWWYAFRSYYPPDERMT